MPEQIEIAIHITELQFNKLNEARKKNKLTWTEALFIGVGLKK